jgi:predicted HAD superfamily Cof-like phosphohydrolase
MANMFRDVKEFHEAFEQPISKDPHLPDADERTLRKKLLKEEYDEYVVAEAQNNLVEIADALADMIYIICGTALSYGIPLNRIWDEVHSSNMAKLHDGKVVKNEMGKVVKPAGWVPPSIARILDAETNWFRWDQSPEGNYKPEDHKE